MEWKHKYNLYYGIRLVNSYDSFEEAKEAKRKLHSPLSATIFYRGRHVG